MNDVQFPRSNEGGFNHFTKAVFGRLAWIHRDFASHLGGTRGSWWCEFNTPCDQIIEANPEMHGSLLVETAREVFEKGRQGTG